LLSISQKSITKLAKNQKALNMKKAAIYRGANNLIVDVPSELGLVSLIRFLAEFNQFLACPCSQGPDFFLSNFQISFFLIETK